MSKKKEEPKKEEEAKDAKKPEGAAGEAGAEGAEGAAPKKSKKKLIIIAVAGVVLLGGGAAGLILSGVLGGGDKKEEATDGEHGEKKEGEHGEATAEGGEAKCVPAPAGGEGGGHGEKKEEPKEGVVYCPKPAYYELPDIVVNLNSSTPRPHFVNLKLTLELKDEASVAEVENQKPRIIDSFNTYLREVRREDLQGSAGTYRLEKEMMLRLDKILGEGTVKDILFREIIVQ